MRVAKEAALEEVRRVLKQDTNMYAARASASDRMLEAMRALENGKGGEHSGWSSLNRRHPLSKAIPFLLRFRLTVEVD